MYKNSPTTALKTDLTIYDVCIKIDPLDTAELKTVTETVEIPEEITSLDGYGIGIDSDNCNYLDLTEKKFYRLYSLENDAVVKLEKAETVDVSTYLTEGNDVVGLHSYGLLRFYGEDAEQPIKAPYWLSYKQKLEV